MVAPWQKRKEAISAVQRADVTLMARLLANGGTGLQLASQRASCGSSQSLSYVDPKKGKRDRELITQYGLFVQQQSSLYTESFPKTIIRISLSHVYTEATLTKVALKLLDIKS